MTLLHCEESWHDWEHAARLSLTPDPLVTYPPFDASHALSSIVTALCFAAGVASAALNSTVVAPASVLTFLHLVLK